jgi:hypothetical protein
MGNFVQEKLEHVFSNISVTNEKQNDGQYVSNLTIRSKSSEMSGIYVCQCEGYADKKELHVYWEGMRLRLRIIHLIYRVVYCSL